MPLSAKQRKQNERERKAALGITKVSTDLSNAQLSKTDWLCEHFGDNKSGNYSRDELFSTLLDKAFEQAQKMPHYSHCNEKLPKGCNGTFKGDSRCKKKFLSQVDIKLI